VGIKELPKRDRTGVYLAYLYYLGLTSKIGKTPPEKLFKKRIRLAEWEKVILFCVANMRSYLGKKFM
jgi:phytoene/squalene synthetase